jgi:PTS system mannitol-specific IIC component
VAGKKETRSSAGAAAFIQFVGGIHEIYFPYVLMNPIVILGPMIGNIAGIFTLSMLGGGLVAAASPGSIIAEMLMTPKGGYIANIAGIAVAAVVSFLISAFLLKFFGKDASLEEAQAQVAANKAASKGQAIPAASTGASVDARDVRKIVFACDAGMGSSAMGATMVRNKLKDAGITDIEVIHPVSEIPGDCQIVVTHHELSGRAAQRAPQARIIPIKNFMGAPEYDVLVKELLDARKDVPAPAPAAMETPEAEESPAAVTLLERKNIVLGCAPVTPEEAIQACGRRMVDSGYVDEAYIQGMLDREASFSVAIGSHVAIPHGTEESRKAIKKTGLIVMTYPEGIQWGDELVRLVVGIASTGEDHLGILGKIVEVAETEEDTDKLVDDATVDQLYKLLNGLE